MHGLYGLYLWLCISALRWELGRSFCRPAVVAEPSRNGIFAHRQAEIDESIDILETQLELSNNIHAQVLYSFPTKGKQKRQPIVFIHGSFHAAWCWTKHYFPYFCSKGHPVVALSLRGTGGTFAGEGVSKVKIDEHAQDLRSFLQQVPVVIQSQEHPILVSHSFGGLAVMKHLEKNPNEAANLSGIVIMCSVPPSGNGKMTMRYLRRSLKDSWKITSGLAMKKCIEKASLCRQLFFGGDKVALDDGTQDDFGVSDSDIELYQGYFKRDTQAVIDIGNLVKNLPSKLAIHGRAPFLSSLPPTLVVGASRDFIVDKEGVEETAIYFGEEPPLFVDSPHDVMLGRNWRNGADAIHNWIQEAIET